MKYLKLLICITFLTSFSFKVHASHVPGGNITFEYVGPNTWVITLTVIEDCGTAFMTNANETITASNNCGLTSPTISLPNIVFQNEVSQLSRLR